MKKNYIYIWTCLLLMAFSLASCDAAFEGEDDLGGSGTTLPEGSPVAYSFGGFTDDEGKVSLKSQSEGEELTEMDNLRLLVFDENGNFIYSRKAVLEGNLPSLPSDDASYLPDYDKKGVNHAKKFSVTLLSSSKKRYIHFIAHHDWTDFPQDYFLEGQSQGQIIPSLITKKKEYWRLLELNGLDENTLKDKVIKLLRNKARVSIEYTPNPIDTKFEIQEFSVYNVADRGTVAPYVFTQLLDFSFPSSPKKPTIPAGITYSDLPFDRYDGGVDIFEHSNAEDKPSFVILKGKLQGYNPGYYKIDLKKFDESTGITSLYDLVRNYWYQVNIQSVLNGGYATAAEAAANPAGNNLFASLEMESYPSVSDGKNTLSIETMEAVFVKTPAKYQSEIYYTAGIDNVLHYLDFDDQIKDEYIQDITFNKTYGDANTGLFTVNFKKIPANETIKLPITLVARPNAGIASGIITRKINLILRPPYSLGASLQTNGTAAGSRVTITFNVPGTIPSSFFPYEVFIETKALTPEEGQGISYDIMNGKYYLKYMVSEDIKGSFKTLNFKRNVANQNETITIKSALFDDATVNL